MADIPNKSREERLLVLILRLDGAVLALAVFAVFLPTEWMDHAHRRLGLGSLPRAPVVEYLTRSLSALYAGLAPVFFYIANDVRKYMDLVVLTALLRGLLGVFLIGIDLDAGMPWFWTLAEGPSIIAISVAQYWLARRVQATSPRPHT